MGSRLLSDAPSPPLSERICTCYQRQAYSLPLWKLVDVPLGVGVLLMEVAQLRLDVGANQALTFLAPIELAIFVLAEGLVGRLAWPALLEVMALAMAFSTRSRLLWTIGTRSYSGASS